MAKLTTEEFIQKSKEQFGDQLDYSKTIYTGVTKKVILICPEHGEFEQEVNSHLRGRGCPICAGKKFSIKEFVKEARKVWNDKYDYTNTVYKGYGIPVTINCPEHGDFEQIIGNHLKGECGCPQCLGHPKDFEKISNTEILIKKAKEKFGDTLDYSKTVFTTSRDKITVTCPKHGDFQTLPYQFLLNEYGCPLCNPHSKSHGEILITNVLTKYNITFKAEYPIITKTIVKKTNSLRVDFFLVYNHQRYFIEYNGEQHYRYIPYMHNNDINNFYLQQKKRPIIKRFM